jgi:hypothetical protein
MTPTIKRRRYHQTRDELIATILARTLAEVEPTRTSIVVGCHLLGQFDCESIDQVVAEVAAVAGDPGRAPALGWPCSFFPGP